VWWHHPRGLVAQLLSLLHGADEAEHLLQLLGLLLDVDREDRQQEGVVVVSAHQLILDSLADLVDLARHLLRMATYLPEHKLLVLLMNLVFRISRSHKRQLLPLLVINK